MSCPKENKPDHSHRDNHEGQTPDQNITHGRAALGSASLDRGFYNRLTLAILSPMKSKEATACGYPAECRRAPFAALYASVR